MAPNAPNPTYNANGQRCRDWLIVARYDEARDVMTLSWTKDGDQWQATKQGAVAYPVTEVSDLLEGFAATVNVLHSPRLF